MNVRLTREGHDELVVQLQEGTEETSVSVPRARPGVESLMRALDEAGTSGHGECFWPCTTGGQYWWMFQRRDAALEVIVMWTRGGATGWEHVFRATDAAEWVRARFSEEIQKLGLASP